MVNSPLIRPYLLGGGSFGGGTLDSHDIIIDVGCECSCKHSKSKNMYRSRQQEWQIPSILSFYQFLDGFQQSINMAFDMWHSSSQRLPWTSDQYMILDTEIRRSSAADAWASTSPALMGFLMYAWNIRRLTARTPAKLCLPKTKMT